MITGIVLENFKCFKRVEIHPKRITCFVGANGTGKSSVLQAFGLLKQEVAEIDNDPYSYNKRDLTLDGPLVNLASGETYIIGFNVDRALPLEGTSRPLAPYVQNQNLTPNFHTQLL